MPELESLNNLPETDDSRTEDKQEQIDSLVPEAKIPGDEIPTFLTKKADKVEKLPPVQFKLMGKGGSIERDFAKGGYIEDKVIGRNLEAVADWEVVDAAINGEYALNTRLRILELQLPGLKERVYISVDELNRGLEELKGRPQKDQKSIGIISQVRAMFGE